ncbi:MAG: SBBP repeat-containing protein [Bacteroidota bacterium]
MVAHMRGVIFWAVAALVLAASPDLPARPGKGDRVRPSGIAARDGASLRPMKQEARFRERREAGKLSPRLARVLDRKTGLSSQSPLPGGAKPWSAILRRSERRSEGGRIHGTEADSIPPLWVRHYSSGRAPALDGANAVARDASGNIYVAGYTTGIFSLEDYLLLKYNTNGQLQWVRTYNGPGNDYDAATAVAVDGAGNVYVTGSGFGVDTDEDFQTVKYTPGGDLVWAARYNGPADDYDAAMGVCVDGAGNVYVTGISYGLSTDADYLTIKYNSSGTQLWTARYDGPANDFDMPVGLGIDLAGSVYVSGTSYGEDTYEDYATVKYSFQGAQVWAARYDGTGMDLDEVAAMSVDISGNSYVTGSSYNADFDADVVTIKYTANGSTDWSARYNPPDESDELAAAIAVDASRNVHVAASQWGWGTGEDYVAIKYSSTGGERWVATYNGPGNDYDEPTCITVDGSGNVFVGGASTGAGTAEDFALVKFSSLGVRLWTARYSGAANDFDAGMAAVVDGAGNAVLAGVSYGSVTDEDVVLVRYNAAGAELWNAWYNGPGNSEDEAVAMAAGRGGLTAITGSSYDLDTQSDYATAVFGPAGSLLWEARYNGTGEGEDYAAAVVVDGSDNVYVTGTSFGQATGYDITTVKYNSAGARQWVSRYTGTGAGVDEAAAIALDPSGNVIVAGSRSSPATNKDYVVIKYGPTGTAQWISSYNGPVDYIDQVYAAAVDASGNVYVTGASFGSSSDFDFLTVKYNPLGTQQWTARYNGSANGVDRAYAIAADASGNVYVTGASQGSGTAYDWCTVKYNASGAEQWAAVYAGEAGYRDDIPAALLLDGAGNIYVTGASRADSTRLDCVTLKYGSGGALLWSARYDGPESDDDGGTALALDGAGNLYVTGYSYSFDTGDDFVTLRYAPWGTLLWASRYDSPASLGDIPFSVLTDNGGNLFVGGSSETEEGAVYTIVKYEAPVAVFGGPSMAFASTQIGCRRDGTLRVRNAASVTPLQVWSVTTSAADFTASPRSFSVPGGDSADVTVRFSPLAGGARSAILVVHHSGVTSPDTVLLTGTGTGSGSAVRIQAEQGLGWRLLSLPVGVTCPMVMPLSFGFNGSYVRTDTLENGRGYWKKLTDSLVSFTGFFLPSDTIGVGTGWTLVGSVSVPIRAAAVRTLPDSIIRTSFFGYGGGYTVADSLKPGFGYWVKTSQPGLLILEGGSAGRNPVPPPHPAPPADRLTVTDEAGNTQRLGVLAEQAGGDAFEMPPPPPAGAFDVRFSTQTMAEFPVEGVLPEIRISGAAGRIVLGRSGEGSAPWLVRANGRERMLPPGASLALEEGTGTILVRMTEGGGETPGAFALYQNHPNPFNPSTTIRFRTAERGFVRLAVYDLLGRQAALPFQGNLAAGEHSVVFDGSGLASGVYFYRLEAPATEGGAGGRTLTRSMILLK